MEHGGTMLVLVDDLEADPAEVGMLIDYGMHGVLVAGTPDGEGCEWLVEVFGDADTALLGDVEPALRLLTAEAVRRPPAPATSGR